MPLGFLTNKEAHEKIAGLEARISELEADAATRDEALSSAQNDLATANENLTAANLRITELEAEANKVGPLEAKVTELEGKVTEAEQSAESRATRMVAATGLNKPLDTDGPTNEGEASKTPHLDALNALSGEERTAYYDANREAIRAEMTR